MRVFVNEVGGRKFLICGEEVAIPIDRIKSIDFLTFYGGSNNCVRIYTDDETDKFVFVHANADAIRSFFQKPNELPLCRQSFCQHNAVGGSDFCMKHSGA